MKNVMEVYRMCRKELLEINMDISNNIVSVRVNGRLRTVLGRCITHRDFSGSWHEIEINPCLLEDDVDLQAAKETMIHELIHTCPGCQNHGYEWKRRGDRASRMLGYNVERLTGLNVLESQGVKVKMETYKYALVCDDCKKEYKFKRWCGKLEYPSRYKCGRCNGNLHTICLDGSAAICKPVWAANKVR